MKALLASVFALSLALAVSADVYLHHMRGSNDRCDEENNDRQTERLWDTENNAAGGYNIGGQAPSYYAGSIMMIEWTNQHSCGGEGKVNCEVVFQYMCHDLLKDGTPDDPTGNGNNAAGTCTTETTVDNALTDPSVGYHETIAFYNNCAARERNRGLFNANRDVSNDDGARATRQNEDANPNGLECAEERDYYPYWHPTPWIDIAVLTTNTSRCSWYKDNSENIQGRNYCTDQEFNNEADCPTGQWLEAPSHRDTYGRSAVSAPVCEEAPWTRDNALGASDNGYLASWNWTIPNNPQPSCVFRIRYNISTNDYDGWNTYSGSNGNQSPVQDDPTVRYGSVFLRLAIDTDQFGRTFEDRTHSFSILSALSAGAGFFTEIYNMNVRGKRGNIAQVRNCVEYDFVPSRLRAAVGDLVHIQFDGSNFNPNGNDGEGKEGTDRTNMVPMINNDLAANYFEEIERQRMFSTEEAAMHVAFINQDPTNCLAPEDTGNANADNNCAVLNAAGPYFNGGLFRLNRSGVFHYMGSRNNNFSNRGQKGTWIISAFNPRLMWGLAFVVIAIGLAATGAGLFFVISGGSAGVYYQKFMNRRASFGSSRRSVGSHRSGHSQGSHRSKGSFGASMI